jgi:hypothetical protein
MKGTGLRAALLGELGYVAIEELVEILLKETF